MNRANADKARTRFAATAMTPMKSNVALSKVALVTSAARDYHVFNVR